MGSNFTLSERRQLLSAYDWTKLEQLATEFVKHWIDRQSELHAQDGGRKPFREVERARTLLEGIQIPAVGRADPMRMP